MLKLTNPYAVVAILIGLLIIGLLLGKNWEKWFPKKVETPATPPVSPPVVERTASPITLPLPLPPATILIPYSPYCRTSVYYYGGCSYTFSRYIARTGRIYWCEMKRTSCP